MVDVIGHPTGRLIGRRNPSSYDMNAVFRAAREEGCGMEVNSQVDRLDLPGSKARRRETGRLSDAHSQTGFGLLSNGVNQARRGWIEAGDVLNTRPLAKITPAPLDSRVIAR